jgi:hypothetical protein
LERTREGTYNTGISINEEHLMIAITRSSTCLALIFLEFILSASLLGQSRQNILGLWERLEGIGGAGSMDTYAFNRDSSFVYRYNSTNLPGRKVIAVIGKYRIRGNSIGFQVLETDEIVGGKIVYDGPPDHLGWIVKGGTKKRIENPSAEEFWVDFKIGEKNDRRTISLDEEVFVLLDDGKKEAN